MQRSSAKRVPGECSERSERNETRDPAQKSRSASLEMFAV
jgi:hypothetical protein